MPNVRHDTVWEDAQTCPGPARLSEILDRECLGLLVLWNRTSIWDPNPFLGALGLRMDRNGFDDLRLGSRLARLHGAPAAG